MITFLIYILGVIVAGLIIMFATAYDERNYSKEISIIHSPTMLFCLGSWFTVVGSIIVIVVALYVDWHPKNPFYKE
jgi:hypothetical protein